ncbi:VOC family protein [Halobaculum rubrum]|uniref:VOC family protein n=1 Tax=Halobaculum rubrum TaxID=2872158 RepID=UPI001CA3E118|nr:VOC family protein [Halobaculum rubrum]QZY01023.1 VOC family protein [Halobaculum rubrum]
MNVRTIDHVNLRIPADGLADARAFYADALGFELEGVDRFEAGDKPFFDVRLAPEHVIHLWPTDAFDAPRATNYDHVALVVDEAIEAVTDRLADAGVEVEQELASPLGATGEAPAVYVRDPFGYRVELKAPAE